MLQQDAEKRYPGQLKLQDRGGSETIGNTEQVEANRRGLVDMTYTAASYYTSIMPEMDAMSLSKSMPWEECANDLNDYLEKLHNAKANSPISHLLGFDPVWFGILMLINLELGQITPPFGMLLFVMKGVAPEEVTIEEICWAAVPYILFDLIVMAMVIAWPQLALWLPNLLRS